MTKPKAKTGSEAHRIEQGVFDAIVELKKMFSEINISKGKGAGLESWAASVGFPNWIHEVGTRVEILQGALNTYRRATYLEKVRDIFQRAIDAGELPLLPEGIINDTDFCIRFENGTVKIIARNEDLPF
jgi:hypothetical protein